MVDTSDIHIIGQIPAYTEWVGWHYIGDDPDAISRGITYAPTKIGTDWPRILWFWGISPPFGPIGPYGSCFCNDPNRAKVWNGYEMPPM